MFFDEDGTLEDGNKRQDAIVGKDSDDGPEDEDGPPTWVDSHSVNCIRCSNLVDERECTTGEDGEGDICPVCQNASDECYYHDPKVCRGEIWICKTCGETYCSAHNHVTDKGTNVECVACERTRKDV